MYLHVFYVRIAGNRPFKKIARCRSVNVSRFAAFFYVLPEVTGTAMTPIIHRVEKQSTVIQLGIM